MWLRCVVFGIVLWLAAPLPARGFIAYVSNDRY